MNLNPFPALLIRITTAFGAKAAGPSPATPEGEYRILNIECRMLKFQPCSDRYLSCRGRALRNSIFLVLHSIFAFFFIRPRPRKRVAVDRTAAGTGNAPATPVGSVAPLLDPTYM